MPPISDEDRDLFRQAMKSIKPLHHSTKLSTTTRRPQKLRHQEPPESQPLDYYLSNHYTTLVKPESTLSYSTQSMPKTRLRELKHGQIPREARLDLHGLKPDSARDALCRFIDQHRQIGHRCLLIIHGKGSRFGEEPVLKNLVNHWLRQLPQVLAFHSAEARDGGNGAVYVLLKKNTS
jgi:DNA-nicking Smr family endonuclease